ncbi:unnamed protein product [Schistosoma curassoni]|uniref:Ovule protein n=1 Tax=Schistosoma curassoni TaxID=6186 RepID=A0A183JRD0_9TREM|nr:unnamed protein product [Schistosoma curassoni]
MLNKTSLPLILALNYDVVEFHQKLFLKLNLISLIEGFRVILEVERLRVLFLDNSTSSYKNHQD